MLPGWPEVEIQGRNKVHVVLYDYLAGISNYTRRASRYPRASLE